MRPYVLITAVLTAALAMTPSAASADVMFQGLGTLPGSWISFAQGVSADGETVVGYCYLPPLNTRVAFRWKRSTGMVPLFDPGSGLSDPVAQAVSGDGSVAVGWVTLPSGARQAFRWTEATGAQPLTGVPGPPAQSFASGISSDGWSIAGLIDDAAGSNAFRWTPSEGVTKLGTLPGHMGSFATAISADGSSVVGVASGGGPAEAFRWTQQEGMIGLGTLPGSPQQLCSARAVSADGLVVVGIVQLWNGVDNQAFRWTQTEGMVGLGFFPNGGTRSDATGVSGDGRIIVGNAENNDGDPPFIWDSEHGMRDLKKVLALDYGLDMTGWSLSEVTGISTDGHAIVGLGYYGPSQQPQAWIAHIPEPSTAALVLAGMGLLVRRARRADMMNYP